MTKKHEQDMRRYLSTIYDKADTEQTIRCYKGEQWRSFGDARFKSRVQVRTFVREIEKYIGRKIRVKFLSAKAGWAWGGHGSIELPDAGHGRTLHTIVHEIAHCVAGPCGHDPKFIRVLLRLVKEFEGAHFAREMEKRMYQTGALKRPKRKT